MKAKQTVSFEELLLSQMIQQEALGRLLRNGGKMRLLIEIT